MPAPQSSDDDSQQLPHISDVKINGPDAHMPASFVDRPIGQKSQVGVGQREEGKRSGSRYDDGISSDAPVLEVNGGHDRAHIVRGDGKELWHDTDVPKHKQGEHKKHYEDDRDFLGEWDKEAHGEAVSRLDSDEELQAELGEDALEASGVQKVDNDESSRRDATSNDEPVGFPESDVDVHDEPPRKAQEPDHEVVVTDAKESEDYGDLVWRQVTEYADEHGIKLSGPDTREIVDRVLKDDGVTWGQARNMPISEHVEFNPSIFDDYR